jgi:hypothetical protein
MELCNYGCGQKANYTLNNGKKCCSEKWQSCQESRRKNGESNKKIRQFEKDNNIVRHSPIYEQSECRYCKKISSKNMLVIHEKFCYLNPLNIILCPICNSPIKDYKNTTTCSQQCGQKFFKKKFKKIRETRDMGWVKELYGGYKQSYINICFKYHDRKCIICGEDIIVAVHHYDGNHNNNDPRNLIPLCMNHHMYIHSTKQHIFLIKECVDEYYSTFSKKFDLRNYL